MVGVAQLVRVPDCDSGCRGFESPRPPQFVTIVDSCGPLAQLVEQETLNLLVLGSSPRRPTIFQRDRVGASARSRKACQAKVAELVDALDLGSSGVTRESSSLSFRTIRKRAATPDLTTRGTSARPKTQAAHLLIMQPWNGIPVL